jgi:CBS domain containing-hemolysin-like protein
MNIEDFFELIEYDGEFETDYETAAGFCQEVLDRFAVIGDKFTFADRYEIEILAADEYTVEKIRVVDTQFNKEEDE